LTESTQEDDQPSNLTKRFKYILRVSHYTGSTIVTDEKWVVVFYAQDTGRATVSSTFY